MDKSLVWFGALFSLQVGELQAACVNAEHSLLDNEQLAAQQAAQLLQVKRELQDAEEVGSGAVVNER